MGAGRHTPGARSTKCDVDVVDDEAVFGHQLRGVGHGNVENQAAGYANCVVVVRGVRVKTNRSGAEIEGMHFAHFRQVVEDLVHRFQRNHRHLQPGGSKDGVGGGVSRIVEDQSENELALGREFTSFGAKPLR